MYRLLPFSTTRRPKRFSNPSTLLSTATLGVLLELEPNGQSFSLALPCRSLSAASCSCSSTCAFRLETTPSRRLSLSRSSASGGFLLLRGARPGPGKTQSIFARTQFEHGFFLSHFTLRRRQVTHDRGLGDGPPAGVGPLVLPFGLWTWSVGLDVELASSDMMPEEN